MILPETIIQIGSPELIMRSNDVQDIASSITRELVTHLQTLLAPNKLIGLSAVQLGIPQRIFITNVREPQPKGKDESVLRVFINPQILKESERKIEMYEGCGSILRNNLFGPVSRPDTVTIEAYNVNGQKFKLTANGILARVIQHEYDHLEGILFTEKVSDYKKLMDLEHYIEFARGNLAQKEAYTITILEEEFS